MTDRFSVGALLKAQRDSMRRGDVSGDRPDRLAQLVLFGLPLVLAVVAWVRNFELADAGSVLAAFGLLAATLVALFVQLAAWRLRLNDRARNGYVEVERPAREAIDEATYHTLVGALVSGAGAVVTVIGSNSAGENKPVAGWLASLVVALGASLALHFIIIVNLVFDAYQTARDGADDHSRV
ncbi:hypothetical protein [Terrabacter terrigena]|uniref:Uncharacterized protein n=1 Tax=Terrabacter terrigena TaxID=574718 RepID=A0ABW3N1Z5_9MICO